MSEKDKPAAWQAWEEIMAPVAGALIPTFPEHTATDKADAASKLPQPNSWSTIYMEVLQPLYGLPWNNTTYGICLGLNPRTIFLCYGGEEKTLGGHNIMWVHLSTLGYIERINFALRVSLFGLRNGDEVQQYLDKERAKK